MASRRKLGVQDALWLAMDRPNNLMVVDAVMWTEEPLDPQRTRDVMVERLWDRYPVFRSRAVRDDDGSWWWEVDEGSSFDDLMSHVELDDPDDPRSLQEFVAARRTRPLEADRPLWEVVLVDRYLGGSAVLTRSHHAVADGMRMMQLAASLFDATPEGGPILAPPPEQYGVRHDEPIHPATDPLHTALEGLRRQAGGTARVGTTVGEQAAALAGRVPGALTGAVRAAGAAVTNPIGATHGWITASWGKVADALSEAGDAIGSAVAASGPLVDAFSAVAADVDVVRKLAFGTRNDAAVWTGTATGEKAVAWSETLSLERVKSVARAEGATVNDVLVACVASTLHRYLGRHHQSCASVTFMVPVNLSPMDLTLPEELGNSFALVQLELPTGEADPRAVLRTVHHRMERIKAGHEAAIAFQIQRTLSSINRSIYEVAVDLLANRTVGVLTNVPGPPMPVYLAGRRVSGMTGWAPLSGDQPMSFTIYSYDGSVTVGIAADRNLVPDHEAIVHEFAPAFAHLEEAVTGL